MTKTPVFGMLKFEIYLNSFTKLETFTWMSFKLIFSTLISGLKYYRIDEGQRDQVSCKKKGHSVSKECS